MTYCFIQGIIYDVYDICPCEIGLDCDDIDGSDICVDPNSIY